MSAAIKPTHKAIQRYHQTLAEFHAGHVVHEGALQLAFKNLLAETARPHGWMLVPEERTTVGGKTVIPDGTLRDDYQLHRGFWEAKDTDDDLAAEIGNKAAKGYPLSNTIFEDTSRAVLFQSKKVVFEADLTPSRSRTCSTSSTPTTSRSTRISSRRSMSSRSACQT